MGWVLESPDDQQLWHWIWTYYSPVVPYNIIEIGHWFRYNACCLTKPSITWTSATNHKWGLLVFTWEQFRWKCSRYVFLIWVSKWLIKNQSHVSQEPMSTLFFLPWRWILTSCLVSVPRNCIFFPDFFLFLCMFLENSAAYWGEQTDFYLTHIGMIYSLNVLKACLFFCWEVMLKKKTTEKIIIFLYW